MDEDRAEKPAAAEGLFAHARRSLRTKVGAWSAPALDAGIRALQSLRKRLCGEQDAAGDQRGARKDRSEGRHEDVAPKAGTPAPRRLRTAMICLGLLLAGGGGGSALSNYLRVDPVVVKTAADMPAAEKKSAGPPDGKAEANPEEPPAEVADSERPADAEKTASADVEAQLEEARAARSAAEKKLTDVMNANAKTIAAQQKKLDAAEKHLAILQRGGKPARRKTGNCELDSGNLNALKDCITAFNR